MTQRRIRHLPVVERGEIRGHRFDRRSREAPHGADRGRSGGDARLYPERLSERPQALEIRGFHPIWIRSADA